MKTDKTHSSEGSNTGDTSYNWFYSMTLKLRYIYIYFTTVYSSNWHDKSSVANV